jgi:hypothetical protein
MGDAMVTNLGFARIAVIIGIGVAVAVLVVAAASYRFSTRQTPRGQPPLVYLNNQNLEELRAAFNAAADHTRVLAMLSPT